MLYVNELRMRHSPHIQPDSSRDTAVQQERPEIFCDSRKYASKLGILIPDCAHSLEMTEKKDRVTLCETYPQTVIHKYLATRTDIYSTSSCEQLH
jgi:hypothetical protein